MRTFTFLAVVLLLLTVVSADDYQRSQYNGIVDNNPAAESRRQWLMSEQRERTFRALLPQTTDASINAVIRDPNLILYTDAEIPLARQIWNRVSTGVHAIRYDISGGADRVGQGSGHEFPWAEPAGTHDVPSSELVEFRGMLLPKDDAGRLHPIVYYLQRQQEPRGQQNVGRSKVSWIYPRGTVFLEALCRKLDDGTSVCFELRVRAREASGWSVDVFRPFVHAADMQARLAQLGYVNHSRRLVAKPVLRRVTLYDSFHPKEQEINEAGNVETLPAFDAATVRALIVNQPYDSALGEEWRDDVRAPAGGINPTGYKAIMEVDSQSCNRCHRATNKSVNYFDLGRDWYGNVRGSDRILSFHIFDPSCISGDGSNRSVAYRRELIQWGVLESFDPRRHPNTIYSALDD